MAEDMRKRAAKATAKVWERYPNYSVCVRGPIDGRSGAPTRMPSLGGPTPQEFADAALLAALDPEDEALVEEWCDARWRADTSSCGEWSDYVAAYPDLAEIDRAATRGMIRAARNKLAQGEPRS